MSEPLKIPMGLLENQAKVNLFNLGMYVFLVSQFDRSEKITVKSVCLKTLLNKHTVLTSLERLRQIGYLCKGGRYDGYELPSTEGEGQFLAFESQDLADGGQDLAFEGQILANEAQNLALPETERQEKERSKEREEKDISSPSDMDYNNSFLNLKENDKEREIQKREKAPEDDEDASERFTTEYREIIAYLNEKTGKKFSSKSRANRVHISARLKEGYTVDDFKTVIDKKYKEWHGTENEKFIRPETLFSQKFDRYLNETNIIRKNEKGWSYRVDAPEDPLWDEIWGAGSGGK